MNGTEGTTAAPHETCPLCGTAPYTRKVNSKGQAVTVCKPFRYLGRWFVGCDLGCHNVTAPADTPEDAWAIWDDHARKERLRDAWADRERRKAAGEDTDMEGAGG